MGVLNREKTRFGTSARATSSSFSAASWSLTSRSFSRVFDLFHELHLEAVKAAKRQGAFGFGMEEIRARDPRGAAEAKNAAWDPASSDRRMLHELKDEVDIVRHTP